MRRTRVLAYLHIRVDQIVCDYAYIHAEFALLECFSTNPSGASMAGIALRLSGQRALCPAIAAASCPSGAAPRFDSSTLSDSAPSCLPSTN
jgi:hypothetical protein